MPIYSALNPVAAAVMTALNVSDVTTLATGGIHDDVPQGVAFPLVLFDLNEKPITRFGTRPGLDGMWELSLRLHIYSQYAGWKEARAILEACIARLVLPLTVSGLACYAQFIEDAQQLPDQNLAGEVCKELIQNARLIVEATA